MKKKLLGLITVFFVFSMVGLVNATALVLGDDTSASVGLGFTFNFFGINYTDINVNSNGNITFGAGAGDGDFSESIVEFLQSPPRIGGAWDDLNPGAGGTVDATGDSASMVVSWSGVPEFASGGSNNFNITLENDGDIWINFQGMTLTDGLVGISDGLSGSDPGGTDFSAVSGPLSNMVTQYELFGSSPFSPFDLANTSLHFTSTAPAPVPEPATMLLFGTGLAGLVGFRLRRKKK